MWEAGSTHISAETHVDLTVGFFGFQLINLKYHQTDGVCVMWMI